MQQSMASPAPQGEFFLASPSQSSPNTTTPNHDDLSWLIAIPKGTRSTCNPHLIYNHRLSTSYFSFISLVSYITIPKNARWRQAMITKMLNITKHES